MDRRRKKRAPARKPERGNRGARGPRGKRGVQGPPGPSTPNGGTLNLAADLIEAQDVLQVQFKRIGQLQADLDDLRESMRDRPSDADQTNPTRHQETLGMRSGTLAISKTRTTPVTYQMIFVPNFGGPVPPLSSLTLQNAEDLRSVLTAVGIGGAEQDKAVRDAIRDNVAVVTNVVLTHGSIEKYRLT